MYDQAASPSPDSTATSTPQWEFKHFEARQRPRLAILQPNHSSEQSHSLEAVPQNRTERRKQQNRVSQRKFRERKEERLRKAGDEVAELQELVGSLQRRVIELESINLQLRGTLSSIGSLCDTNPNPLFSEQLGLLHENQDSEFEQHLVPFQTAFEDLDLQAYDCQSQR